MAVEGLKEYVKNVAFASNDKDPAYLSKISVKSSGRTKIKQSVSQQSGSSGRSKWNREIQAAIVIQRAYRSYYIRNIEQLKHERKTAQLKAARLIWKVWTSYRMKKQFRFYRSLIDVSDKLDPYYILKSINPKEAKLIDKAAGTLIRFRLGGENFPPNIYYKIGTYRSIVDLCALSPRDYASLTNRMASAKERHNRPTKKPTSGDDDKRNWYERYENNGWRLVTDKAHVVPVYQDFITLESSQRRRHFHYSKLVRRQDVEKRHKEHRLAWIMKMYKAGMAKEREEQEQHWRDKEEAKEAVEGVAGSVEGGDGPVKRADRLGKRVDGTDKDSEGRGVTDILIDGMDDRGVDDLIRWSQDLDFDKRR